MEKLKGTKTEENLWTAFAGESQARNKYTYFAEAASKEGYEDVASTFEKISHHEKEHAKTIFQFLNGIKDTATNLSLSSQSEHYEATTMYEEFEKVARQEGFEEIAEFFKEVAKIEMEHEKTFLSLLAELQKQKK
ncbi:Rubrerythrin [Natronincola peptidivorans]|uniref:Rubrerythrin n=1 Tax=Natronincola peptidivorans TaxID=426128 RepID=A0A1I0A7G0_9FIRM|nr:rubrerythrin family protein [Natronincola peptidivorans]SES90105.1 Rubrerythrin [Natronincola peptidivorans]